PQGGGDTAFQPVTCARACIGLSCRHIPRITGPDSLMPAISPPAAMPSLQVDRSGWPADFAHPTAPAPAPVPRLLAWNADLAARLGWSREPPTLAALWFGGNARPPGAEAVANVYAGHQFGTSVPQLGDGRAILLGDAVAPDGQAFEIQLKGAGRTPFSRNGDGRAALGPVLREY